MGGGGEKDVLLEETGRHSRYSKRGLWVQGVRIAEAKTRRTLTRDDPIAKAFGLVLALAALSFFIIRNVHGWTFLPFGDEAAHLLGALALHSGDRLYRS